MQSFKTTRNISVNFFPETMNDIYLSTETFFATYIVTSNKQSEQAVISSGKDSKNDSKNPDKGQQTFIDMRIRLLLFGVLWSLSSDSF